jgi:ABC-type polysaccharide/polyol phosphate export permease
LNWNKLVRQVHRWVSIIFVVTVVAVSVVAGTQEEPAEWVFFLPLPPLFVLLLTGLNLFVLPYTARWRSGRAA